MSRAGLSSSSSLLPDKGQAQKTTGLGILMGMVLSACGLEFEEDEDGGW